MAIELRAAVESDVPALQTLLRNSWLTTWAPEIPFAGVQRFAAEDPAGAYARDTWREFMVAVDGGALLGMFHVEGDHLHAIHLDPRHKRRKLGTRLMDEVERRIVRDYAEATLEARSFNTGAIAFYEQRGWTRRRAYMATECGQPCETVEMVKVLR